MCTSEIKHKSAVLRARFTALMQRPEFVEALRIRRRQQELRATSNATSRRSTRTRPMCRMEARKRACGAGVHNEAVLPAADNKLVDAAPEVAARPAPPEVTPRMLQSVSLGLSHVEVCDGCDHPVCLKTREMLRKVLNHKQRCTQEPINCNACYLWDRTVQLHHRLRAIGESPPK